MKNIIRAVIWLFIMLCWSQYAQAQAGEWTWVSGDSDDLSPGLFGTRGTASVYNNPNAVSQCSRWIDHDGNLWLFGGNCNYALYNALWKFDVTVKAWTWVKGDSIPNLPSVYGTKGVAADLNTPGARANAATWVDDQGNFWLFGGGGIGLDGTTGRLNDLWKYNLKTNQWTWVSGETILNSMGTYGTKGLESAQNTPPAKEPVTGEYVDANGNLWLYSGYNHYDFATVHELWRFNVATDNWAFVSGIPTYNAPDISSPAYGPVGVYGPSYHPGGRNYFCAWSGDSVLYLFSGDTYRGSLSDFWGYNMTDNSWAWLGGSKGRTGIHDQTCIPSVSDFPAARAAAPFHQSSCNGFFVYGGLDYQSHHLSDFWYYNPSTQTWTCIAGDDTSSYTNPRYGIKQVSNPLNTPGSRACGAMWVDKQSNVWLFGGQNQYVPPNTPTTKNDLWKYETDWLCLKDTLQNQCIKKKPVEQEKPVIPNVFTPDGDHVNDHFTIQAKYYTVKEVLVYNRWGEQIYRDKDVVDWDGTSGSNDCPAGTYYYIITLKKRDNTEHRINGVITLIR